MSKPKTITVKVERTIPGPISEVFAAWLNPEVPGTPWSESDKILLNAKVDGMFYWRIRDNAHFGRFTEIEKPTRLQHTWMSKHTLGEESKVTITFKAKGEDTVMTLVHSDLPDTEGGRGHEKGWNYFVGNFADKFGR